MDPLDAASQRFEELRSKLTPEYWKTIDTEADVRMKVIDSMFVSVLGWPESEISLESNAGAGFIDYRHTIGGFNRLITEAKRKARTLGIDPSRSGRHFVLKGPAFPSEAIKEGIDQAIRYCGYKNAELACVTNGHQWVVFRGNRLGDGRDTMDGMAYVFGSVDGIKEHFKLFYDLLSFEAVSDYRYRALFQEAEGQPVRMRAFRQAARRRDSRKMLPIHQLNSDLDRVMLSFFRDITGEEDPEARRQCFVTTPESDKAETGLARLSEELVGRVKILRTEEGRELSEAIRRVHEMQRKEFVLIVGTKGSGKSTFVERFFKDVLPQDLVQSAVNMRVELDGCGCDSTTIIKWLDEHLLEVAEQAVFPNRPPTFDELQGMYWREYERWREGPYKHLYEREKDLFKDEFGRHIEKRREERPHEYIMHLIHRVVFGLGKIPCLVFDNADHFDIAFQEAVFRYAHSLYTDCLCLVLLPITDTTSWQLSRQGPLQSFFTDSYYLPTPPTQKILQKRIEYIDRKIEEEKPEVGRGYFLGRGIPLSIENLQGFTHTLQTLFLRTGVVAHWIESLCNHDIRRCLTLTREIVASPYVKVLDLLKAFVAKTAMEISNDDAKLAIIRGRYDIYPVDINNFVQNTFTFATDVDTSPLLGVRILAYLNMAWTDDGDPQLRFVEVEEVVNFFRALNFEIRAIRSCLDAMLKTGLCLSFDPTTKGINETKKLEIAPSGRQHLEWSVRDWIYLESMAEVTPVLESESCETIRNCLVADRADLRRKAIKTFLKYLLDEDHRYCLVPNHEVYKRQLQIDEDFRRLAASCDAPAIGTGSNRYVRHIGKINNWITDKGYGFIRQENPAPDAFAHIKDILGVSGDIAIPVGCRVEYDLGDSGDPDKPKAVSILILDWTPPL